MTNDELRKKIIVNQLRNWEVAQAVGISDSRFSVWLRTPLNSDRLARVEHAINMLIEEKEAGVK